MSKYLTVIGLILIVSMSSFAQSKKTKAISRGERLINALINSKNTSLLWGDDGFEHGERTVKVVRIFRLGRRAIPLLIKHLDDRRLIKWIFRADPENQENITVGEAVLGLLTYIVRVEAPFFDMACIKNGEDGSCVSERFYFGKRGKRNWLKAFRGGKIHYEKSEY